jgi:dihydrofolate reductase
VNGIAAVGVLDTLLPGEPRECAVPHTGLVDEFTIALSPVLFGTGIHLFDGVDASRVALEQVRVKSSQRVTHLTYAVRQR